MLDYNPIIDLINYNKYQIGILRLDLIDPEISGNKWFKLKYNLAEAKKKGKSTIITFGGAFSNHIAATAAACKQLGFNSIGIIRGDETSSNNSTLLKATENGMQLHFVDRIRYKQKDQPEFLSQIQQQYPNCYIIPEGGDNELGAEGCKEILQGKTDDFDIIFCATGTGTTFSGLAQSLKPYQKLYGINVLKFEASSKYENSKIINDYHFGGYAKHTQELLEFKYWFETNYHTELDYVYTSKSFYAAFDLIKKNLLNSNKKILIIHCGGLQGNVGYRERYRLSL